MKTFDPASIATRRKKLRKTQQDLARETGLSSTAIYYIEKGRKVPRATTLVKSQMP
jgi:DNA-binding XRE family transcriptional regulator